MSDSKSRSEKPRGPDDTPETQKLNKTPDEIEDDLYNEKDLHLRNRISALFCYLAGKPNGPMDERLISEFLSKHPTAETFPNNAEDVLANMEIDNVKWPDYKVAFNKLIDILYKRS